MGKPATVTCKTCKRDFDYEDDGVSVACMPDGAIVGNKWHCDDCITCEICNCTCLPDECGCPGVDCCNQHPISTED